MGIPGSPQGGVHLGQASAHFPQGGGPSLALRCLGSQPQTFWRKEKRKGTLGSVLGYVQISSLLILTIIWVRMSLKWLEKALHPHFIPVGQLTSQPRFPHLSRKVITESALQDQWGEISSNERQRFYPEAGWLPGHCGLLLLRAPLCRGDRSSERLSPLCKVTRPLRSVWVHQTPQLRKEKPSWLQTPLLSQFTGLNLGVVKKIKGGFQRPRPRPPDLSDSPRWTHTHPHTRCGWRCGEELTTSLKARGGLR